MTLIHGTIRDASRAHGTSVLGEICAVDNTIGGVGIVPNVASVLATSFHTSTRPDAILAALAQMDFGDVLPIEAQVTANPATTSDLLAPIEIYDADFEALRLATALGIIVVEAGGNGTDNGSPPPLAMDTWVEDSGRRLLWPDPSNADFRDFRGDHRLGGDRNRPAHGATTARTAHASTATRGVRASTRARRMSPGRPICTPPPSAGPREPPRS